LGVGGTGLADGSAGESPAFLFPAG